MTSQSLESSAHSDVVTHGVRVVAAAEYAPRESDPDKPLHMFVYRVRITNEGDETVRLESRHWVIVDGNGERRDVRGPGVVGEYPSLAPGQSFQYESRCPLTTSWGTMEGSYRFVLLSAADGPVAATAGAPGAAAPNSGGAFEVEVGRFFLAPSVPPIVQQMSR